MTQNNAFCFHCESIGSLFVCVKLCEFTFCFICWQELIQNADDAQATEVVFIHDERSYGGNSLWTDELEKYQGTNGIRE